MYIDDIFKVNTYTYGCKVDYSDLFCLNINYYLTYKLYRNPFGWKTSAHLFCLIIPRAE